MKAMIYTTYGPPTALELKEVEMPSPKENEVLIEICASSANPADWHLIRGKPFIARLGMGLSRPKKNIPGIDLAGKVVAVGNQVKAFRPGDEVFGDCGFGGAFAEYACTPEGRIALKPINATFGEAAAMPVAAITALQGLRAGRLKGAGQKVLINGASGGVGTYAVQIAKSLGAEVTGVCSAANFDLVRSIGADHVIDYTRNDFTRMGGQYDLILDTVGNRKAQDYRRALAKNGRCVIIGFTTMGRMVQQAFIGGWLSIWGNRKVVVMGTAKINQDDLNQLKGLYEKGRIKTVTDRQYPFHEAGQAVAYVEKGHAKGKVVINIK